jgi:hypothetical protein
MGNHFLQNRNRATATHTLVQDEMRRNNPTIEYNDALMFRLLQLDVIVIVTTGLLYHHSSV